MNIPYLYRKLLKKYTEADTHYQQNRAQLSQEIASTFRISKKELPSLLEELNKMKKVEKVNRFKVKLIP